MRKTIALLASLVILAASSPLWAKTKNPQLVVVTYSILGNIVEQLLAGQTVNGKPIIVKSLIPNGQDPHQWEPSAQDRALLDQAQVVVENGLGLEGGLLKSLSSVRKNTAIYTATDHIIVRRVGAGEGVDPNDVDQQAGAQDPHIWTSPRVMIEVVNSLVPFLEANLKINLSAQKTKMISELSALDKSVQELVASLPVEKRILVTGHESLGYFARDYQFKLIGALIPSLSSEAEASASQLAQLKTKIEDSKATVIFTELGTSPKISAQIAKESHTSVVELNTHILPAGGTYTDYMLQLATTLVTNLKK